MKPGSTSSVVGACMFRAWLVSTGLMVVLGIGSELLQARPAPDVSRLLAFLPFVAIYCGFIAVPCGLLGGLVAVMLLRFKTRPWAWNAWTFAGGLTGLGIPLTVALVVFLKGGEVEAFLVAVPSLIGLITGAVVAASLSKALEELWQGRAC